MSSSSVDSIPHRPLHCSGSYFIYKMLGLVIYTTLLSNIIDGHMYQIYKLITFIIITPIIKWYAWRPITSIDWKRFYYSVVVDTIGAWIGLYWSPIHLFGWNWGWSTAINLGYNLPVEYGEYLLFDYGTGTSEDRYIVRLSKNPADGLLALVIAMSYAILGWYVDIYTETRWTLVSWYTPLLFVLILTIHDGFFGAAHWCLHVYPHLWNKHKLHHEYKREDLNMFASFYADFLDTLLMASGFYITLLLCIMCGGATWHVMADIGLASVMSHNKYVMRRGACLYFWEYDAIDLLFGHSRLSEYHYSHHMNLSRSYGLFGFIPDHWYPTYVPRLIKWIQSYDTWITNMITTQNIKHQTSITT